MRMIFLTSVLFRNEYLFALVNNYSFLNKTLVRNTLFWRIVYFSVCRQWTCSLFCFLCMGELHIKNEFQVQNDFYIVIRKTKRFVCVWINVNDISEISFSLKVYFISYTNNYTLSRIFWNYLFIHFL